MRPSEELDKANLLYLCNPQLTAATIKQFFKMYIVYLLSLLGLPHPQIALPHHTQTLKLVGMGVQFEIH